MRRLVQENILALLLLALFVAILVMSFGYGPRARMVPVPISVLGILLTLAQLYWQNTRPEDDLHVDLLQVLTKEDKSRPASPAPDVPEPDRAEGGSIWVALGFVGALLALMLLVGPFIGLFLFITGYLTASRYGNLLLALGLAASMSVALYLIFVIGLQLQVYHGVLDPVVRSLGL